MALETRSSRALDTIHTDVLSQARLACYKARDAFYTCLEREANKKATEIASVGLLYPLECKQSREDYVKQCRPTWVKHFDRQYCARKRVNGLLDDNESRRAIYALFMVVVELSRTHPPLCYYFLNISTMTSSIEHE